VGKDDCFLRVRDIFTICPLEQIEIITLKKKTKDRVQTGTIVVPKIYQEELARSNFTQTVLTLASSAIDDSEFSFRIFN
jgi:hypothetical protein